MPMPMAISSGKLRSRRTIVTTPHTRNRITRTKNIYLYIRQCETIGKENAKAKEGAIRVKKYLEQLAAQIQSTSPLDYPKTKYVKFMITYR